MGTDAHTTAMLTREDIRRDTGVEQLEELEKIEILFTTAQEIGGLEGCYKLQSLSLISNDLRRISNLQPVSASLRHLCLCEQEITSIENLQCPNLTELLLHRNKITQIRGLDGCPRLKRLWLFTNNISKMENVHPLADLEELWLHDNQITVIEGLDSLVHLRNLGLAGNDIKLLQDLQPLSNLRTLTALALQDMHFGRCPVTEQEGYRDFVCVYLKSVCILDGVEICQVDEAQAAHRRNQLVFDFNTGVDELESQLQRQLQELYQRAQAEHVNTQSLEKEMGESLAGLEALIAEGRKSVDSCVQRQRSAQRAAIEGFKADVQNICVAYDEKLTALLDKHQVELRRASHAFALVEKLISAEATLFEMLCDCRERLKGDLSFQLLGEHSPEFQLLYHHGWASLEAAGEDNALQSIRTDVLTDVEIARVYRLLHKTVSCAPTLTAGSPRGYVVCSPSSLAMLLNVDPSVSTTKGVRVYTHLASAIALECTDGDSRLPPTCVPFDPARGVDGAAAYTVENTVVVLAVTLRNQLSVPISQTPRVIVPAEDARDQIHQHLCKFLCGEDITALQAVGSCEDGTRKIYVDSIVYMVPSRTWPEAAALNYVLLCVSPGVGGGLQALEERFERLMLPRESAASWDHEELHMIQELQEELQTHVQRYEEHVVEEVDPTTADRLREIDAEIDLRADAAQLLAAQVQRERQSQEQQLLQTCRRLHGSARVPTRSAHTPPTPTSARAAIPQPHKGHARARMSSQSTFPRKATAKASD